jgi:hypothetical protein
VDSELEGSDDEEEWTYPEGPRNSKGTPKKLKKDPSAVQTAGKTGRGPGRPPKQHKDRAQHGSGDTAANFHSIKVWDAGCMEGGHNC